MAPQPAWVTGPRQGVPWATITHTVPRRLHSTHTLCARTRGRRPARCAAITSSSWLLLIGHPLSSKSTGTCALIGVEVRERRDVVRRGVDDRGEVLDVGEVAQRLDPAGGRAGADRDQRPRAAAHLLDALGVVGGGDRALDDRDVVGALDGRAAGLEEVGDLPGDRPAAAARPRSRAGSAGSRRRRRTSTRRASACGRGHHSSRIASQRSSSLHA